MEKIKVMLMGIGLVLAGGAIAEDGSDSLWLAMARTEDNLTTNVYSAKKGTFKHAKRESSLLMQDAEENKVTKKSIVAYNKVVISDEACDNGYGKTKFFSLDGKFLYDTDYIEGGRSVGSNIGEFLCIIRAELTKQGKI
ncbi:hypothetical protein [Atlantibacter sp.]|uniref:hypothetical protein n=1 Tax=Atlantibacter sp. TaxID=1903473 RepID=UPI0028A6632A|nr:hypothetical protein [Atlantibacter sp.]